MSAALLRTKLFIPSPHRSLVYRERVAKKLDAGLYGKLTLVSAPAGFGKSTALSTWASAAAQPVAWLSLDASDNDPVRFWTYVRAALRTLHPGIGSLMPLKVGSDAARPSQLEANVVDLINDITEVDHGRLLFVIDDYHLIQEPKVNDSFSFFIENAPSQLHTTLAGRTDPPWSLARARARGELTEVRTPDLRFTVEETAAFLQEVMGLRLCHGEIAKLEERTEGWIAGLQMAALSMQDNQDLAGFIDALSGSHRFIMDYLLEEVLNKQPQAIRDFLLQTSILDRLTPALCDAVTQRKNGEETLTYLEQANLFLIPLDEDRRWYRYHHLFADLLVSRQQRLHAEEALVLHRRASAWYRDCGQLGEAMNHAYAAGDIDRQVALLADNVLSMAYQGELTLLVRWLDRLPSEHGRHRPWFHISRAWVLAFAGHLDEVEQHLTEAEAALDGVLDTGEYDHVSGHVAAIRGYIAGLQGEWQRCYVHANEALARFPDSDMIARGWTTLLLAIVLRSFGQLAEADAEFGEAYTISRQADFFPLTVDILWERSDLQRMQGRLQAALDNCRSILELADSHFRQTGRRLAPAGYAHCGLAGILLERNELDLALQHAREGVRLCEHWGMADAIVRSHIQLSFTLQATGDIEAALKSMKIARRTTEGMSPMYRYIVSSASASLALQRGEEDKAIAWAESHGLDVDDEFSFNLVGRYLLYARLHVFQGLNSRPGAFRKALRILDRLQAMISRTGATGDLLQVLALKSIALDGVGENEAALQLLTEALQAAEPEGYRRTFIGLGEPMAKLLRQILRRGLSQEYVRELLTIIDETTNQSPSVLVIDPLTERELEVLRMLPTSLSTVEIATELVVAPSTVRTHIKRIYSKLHVSRRMDAVQRATELHLI